MSGQITRKFGHILYLEAQLSDGIDSFPARVISDLLLGDGSLYKTVELAHVSKGVFIESTEMMPNEPVLIVKHYVYESNGSTLKPGFGPAEDRYMLAVDSAVSADLKRNGFTQIIVSKDQNAIIETSNKNTKINTLKTNNIIIQVSDDDTSINSDGNNTEIGV